MENNLRDSLIEEWALDGLNVKKIVGKLAEKEIPCATKTVSKVLKNKGFEYNSKTFIWDKPQQLDNIIVSNTNRDHPNRKLEIEQNNYVSNRNAELIEMLGFTLNEFDILKEIITERIEGKNNSSNANLVEEIAKLRVRERKNRSYYISKEIGDQVAELAASRNLKISNIVEVALIDFLQRYN